VVLPLVKVAQKNPGWREFHHKDHQVQRGTLEHRAVKDIKKIMGNKHMGFCESGQALLAQMKTKASSPAYANCPALRQGKARPRRPHTSFVEKSGNAEWHFETLQRQFVGCHSATGHPLRGQQRISPRGQSH